MASLNGYEYAWASTNNLPMNSWVLLPIAPSNSRLLTAPPAPASAPAPAPSSSGLFGRQVDHLPAAQIGPMSAQPFQNAWSGPASAFGDLTHYAGSPGSGGLFGSHYHSGGAFGRNNQPVSSGGGFGGGGVAAQHTQPTQGSGGLFGSNSWSPTSLNSQPSVNIFGNTQPDHTSGHGSLFGTQPPSNNGAIAGLIEYNVRGQKRDNDSDSDENSGKKKERTT